MNIQAYVEHIFNQKIRLEKTNLGLTNQIYIAYIDNIKYAIRVPMNDSDNIIYNKHEEVTLKLIDGHNLDVDTIFYDPINRIKITKWVDCKVYQEYKNDDKLIKVANLMHRLHDLKLHSTFDFNAWDLFDKYYSQINEQLFNIEPYLCLKDMVKKLTDNTILCHNDFVSGNILLSKEHDYLIDYEFAANNDPIFDVTSFITENNLNENERMIFINAYFDKIDELLMYKIIVFECFHNLLWLQWATLMYESRKNNIYYEIANLKYQSLIKTWEKLKKI